MQQLRVSVFLLFLTHWLAAQEATFPVPLSARTSNYDISVQLDTEKHMVHGKETLTWTNPSDDEVPFIRFHLYLNAFRNTSSTFNREASGNFNSPLDGPLKDADWAWINIDHVEDMAGNDLTANLEYVQPDDDNKDDRTVIQLNLPEPVGPRGTIVLKLDFTSKLHSLNVRTGFSKTFYHNVQWFPKTGVYEPAGSRFAKVGQWNCHQYHPTTEYFGEYGNFNVDITVPKDYKMGGSGTLYKEEVKGEKKTYYFHAEDVIDFAWTTSPNVLQMDDKWKDVDIKLLIAPEYDCCGDRYISAAKHAMDYLGDRLMDYPWPMLTIIVPPFHAAGAGAMEYPTLITAPGLYNFPSWLRTPEYFVIHEFVHQYFHLMIGTNEFEEAWMDEGFTSYWKSRVLDHAYGEKQSVIDLGFFQMGAMEFFRSRYTGMKNLHVAESTRAGWEYENGRDRALYYSKPATWLRTMEGFLGTETMDKIMHTFFHRWKFKHPSRFDFIEVVNEVVSKNHGTTYGESMNWFFDQVLTGTGDCDYEVSRITNDQLPKEDRGIFEEKGMKAERRPNTEYPTAAFQSRVVVSRLGDIYLPQEVLVRFEDGTEILEKWDGKKRTHGFVYTGNSKVASATIDPEEKIYMDKNFLNNSLRTEPDTSTIRKYMSQLMLRLQHVLQGVSFLV